MPDITLGQFVPKDSPVHRLDPRTKIIGMILYVTAVLLIKSVLWAFAIPAVFVIFVTLLSKVPLGYLWKAIKPLRWVLLMMFVLQILMVHGAEDTVWLSWWKIVITKESVLNALFISLRLVLLVTGTSLMTLTTSPLALTDGLERLLAPLKVIKFPAHELALMMSIALRMIPVLMEETERVRKAQLSRGADFESGNILRRAKAMIPILIPLFVSAFRRADELAMAMESRCYHGGEGRTKLHVLRCTLADLWAFLCLLIPIAAAILCERFFGMRA